MQEFSFIDSSRTQNTGFVNSEAREWRHDWDKTRTNKLEWWIILKISVRVKASVPKTFLKRKVCLYSLCFPQKTLCWLSLPWNSVICILFLDFVRFAKAKRGKQSQAPPPQSNASKKVFSKARLFFEMRKTFWNSVSFSNWVSENAKLQSEPLSIFIVLPLCFFIVWFCYYVKDRYIFLSYKSTGATDVVSWLSYSEKLTPPKILCGINCKG